MWCSSGLSKKSGSVFFVAILLGMAFVGCFTSQDLTSTETMVTMTMADPWEEGETERVLWEGTVVAGECYPTATVIELVYLDSVMGGCAHVPKEDVEPIPVGSASLRIEADATEALHAGEYFAVLYTNARTTLETGDGEPSRDPVHDWTFPLEASEWDAPDAEYTDAYMGFWSRNNGTDPSLLQGPIDARVVAERDLDWSPPEIVHVLPPEPPEPCAELTPWHDRGAPSGATKATPPGNTLPPPLQQVTPPEQVRLGLPSPDTSSTLSVSWLEQAPRVNPIVLLETPTGTVEVDAHLRVGPSAGFVYEAVFENLLPDTIYTYWIENREFSFTTPPVLLGEDDEMTIVALGDHHITDESRAATRAIVDLDPDLVLHAGDLSYAHGDPVQWKEWFDMVEPVAATRPWVPVLGNHETYTQYGPVFVPDSPVEMEFFKQRFTLPGETFWYSFTWGGIHVVGLDTFSRPADEFPWQEQMDWLDANLAANAEDALWTIVFLHEPPHHSNTWHRASERVQVFMPILEAYDVDLLVGAHVHAYERTHPMIESQATRTGTNAYEKGDGLIHIVTGGAGANLYTNWMEPPPEWSAARAAIHHVTHLTVTRDAIVGCLIPTDGEDFEDGFLIQRAIETNTHTTDALEESTLALSVPGPAALDVPLVDAFDWRRQP